MASDRRIQVLARHMASQQEDETSTSCMALCHTSATTSVDPAQLYDFITRDNKALRQSIFAFLKASWQVGRFICR